METLPGEHVDEYYKSIYGEISSLTRRDMWEVSPRDPVSDHNVITGTCYFKCNFKPD